MHTVDTDGMGDMLGLSSVLSLSSCIVQTFKAVEDIRRAPVEVQKLEEQSRILHQVLHDIGKVLQNRAVDGVMGDTLRKAERILVNVSGLLALELPRKGDRPISKRGATWLKSRDKFTVANAELRDLQMSLLLALSLYSCELMQRQDHSATVTAPAVQSPSSKEASVLQRRVSTASPASPFETSAGFMPEMYTVDEASPTLFTNKSVQLDMSDYTMTNFYAMFYRATGRRWIRVSAMVTISIESQLFDVGRLSPSSVKSCEPLAPIARELQRFLGGQVSLASDTHLSLYVGGRFFSEATGSKTRQIKLIDSPPAAGAVETQLRDAASMLYHAGCTRIQETYIVQFPQPARLMGAFFSISQFQSEWMLDLRFTLDRKMNDALLYQLRALRRVQGKRGISPLVGAIAGSDDRGALKGFLIKLPRGGFLFRRIYIHETRGLPIPWSLRERWCRDMVRAVANVHANELLVGHLGRFPNSGICLDQDHHLVLHGFRPFYVHYQTDTAIVPPEHRDAAATDRDGALPSTPYTDIFQLGLALWLVASASLSYRHQVPEEAHPASHLTRLKGDVPDYINHAIAACRSEEPLQRISACELLHNFPPEDDGGKKQTKKVDSCCPSISTSATHDQDAPPPESELEYYQGLYDRIGYCDGCGALLAEKFFVCTVCCSGDFYVCHACHTKGGHCLDNTHYLVEQRLGDKGMSTFHSSAKGGTRKVVDLLHGTNF